jgi:hypothetical protein
VTKLKIIIYFVLRVVTSIVGIIAGCLGAMHGYFEILQRNVAINGFLIDAKTGNSISMELIASGQTREPAVTIIPNFLITGVIAIIFSIIIIVWATFFIQKKNGGLFLILLSVILFLFGGGFVPAVTGIIGGIIGTIMMCFSDHKNERIKFVIVK